VTNAMLDQRRFLLLKLLGFIALFYLSSVLCLLATLSVGWVEL